MRIVEIDKPTLRAFNYLAYDCKINRSLATNMHLSLLEYYNPKKTLKKINIRAFWLYFLKIIFHDTKDKKDVKDLILFSISTKIPTSIFMIITTGKKNLNHNFSMIIWRLFPMWNIALNKKVTYFLTSTILILYLKNNNLLLL